MAKKDEGQRTGTSVFIFDLDGTLVDSNYLHALAWREAFHSIDLDVPTWQIHRRIGMSGGLLANEVTRQTGSRLTAAQQKTVEQGHAKAFARRSDEITPTFGAIELLHGLGDLGVPWAIASSSTLEDAKPSLALLDLPKDAIVITSDDISAAKPDPGLFLAAAERIAHPGDECFVVGDAVWDLLAARRAGHLGLGVLTGGYSSAELLEAGAFRVFDDTGHLFRSLDLMGVHADDDESPAEATGAAG